MLLLPAVFDLGNYTYWRRRSIWLAIRAYLINAKDRKSTRLNSSHGYISYAVFCLKKKKKELLAHNSHNRNIRMDNRPCNNLLFELSQAFNAAPAVDDNDDASRVPRFVRLRHLHARRII